MMVWTCEYCGGQPRSVDAGPQAGAGAVGLAYACPICGGYRDLLNSYAGDDGEGPGASAQAA